MKRILVLVGFLIFAGTAHAQFGGSINNYGSLSNGGDNMSSTGGINGGTGHLPPRPSPDFGAADNSVNQNSKNPGQFVPSTFASYGDVLTLAEEQARMKPITVAEAARLAQAQKKNDASGKPPLLLEQNRSGRLYIAAEKK